MSVYPSIKMVFSLNPCVGIPMARLAILMVEAGAPSRGTKNTVINYGATQISILI